MNKPERKKIERAAHAIRFLVPLDECGKWTEKGLQEVKFPRDFTPSERKMIRLIARTVLQT
jgi:hypothetical protein